MKVRLLTNGQYITTIPKNIAEAMGLRKGDTIKFLFSAGDVIIRKEL